MLDFSFQELDLSTEAFFYMDSSKEQLWIEAVERSLHAKGMYRRVSTINTINLASCIKIRMCKHTKMYGICDKDVLEMKMV